MEVGGRVSSPHRIGAIEVMVNGDVITVTNRTPRTSASASREELFHADIRLTGPSWVAVRCWEQREDGRIRFAHSAPFWIDDPWIVESGAPLRPRRQEIDWLAASMRKELARSRPLLPAAAVKEYEEALAFYEGLRGNARP
jgi:hypothetical protein